MKVLCLAFACFTSAAAFAAPTYTLDSLTHKTQDELDDIYANSQAGDIPDGASDGRAVFFAGSLAAEPLTRIASMVWQGKVFDKDDGVLVNRVFGFKLIKAEVYFGESNFDGAESIIVDYKDTSLLARPVRDEIRQVGPNLYLGRAYARTWIGPVMVVNFILDFSQANQ